MRLDEVLTVLLGWIGLEIEVGTHGADGALPIAALEARGILRRGEEFGVDDGPSALISFRLEDSAGDEVASLRLYDSAFSGGGWLDDAEEVLEIRSGVIRILVTTVIDPRWGNA